MTAETEGPDPTTSLLAFFGSEAHRLRTEAGWSQLETAKKAFATQAMISYIESAKRVPSAELAAGLDVAFGTGGHFMRLHPLVLRYAYPSWFLPYVELERDASSIHTFEAQVVPGLLQTEGYARAMFGAVRPDNLDDLVAARLSRQAVLEREDRPRAWFVIDEQVLRRAIGGPAVMAGQLERLLKAGAHPRTVIQVIPERVTAHAGLAGPFTIMGFTEGVDVLYVDGYSQGRLGTDASEVAGATHAYDLLRAVALSPEESAELIGARLEDLSR
ncbi:transcriptional regulator with XRE-family HTH domain [Kitasatospora sp. MAA4]|uniref:helix-turn-helix domain-containing protein n=1 Tax=Kitasatospora sp. MAA4 TaxID=3035093 RepID=UPI002475BD17|nr:helix-turn-helix transcriptional regulator [Kitasatospora sp. MAA4]MDH6137367.1 transcriptional regulator with XRE-family HTH domain [Kitasatospora sp. MAA4]